MIFQVRLRHTADAIPQHLHHQFRGGVLMVRHQATPDEGQEAVHSSRGSLLWVHLRRESTQRGAGHDTMKQKGGRATSFNGSPFTGTFGSWRFGIARSIVMHTSPSGLCSDAAESSTRRHQTYRDAGSFSTATPWLGADRWPRGRGSSRQGLALALGDHRFPKNRNRTLESGFLRENAQVGDS